jgi:hypothetical protein
MKPTIGRRTEMLRYVFAVVAIACGLGPSIALAQSGYTNVTITSVNLYQASQSSTPGTLIVYSPSPGTGSDAEGCASSGIGYAWIDWSSATLPDGKALHEAVLAAFMAGRPIGIGIKGCSSAGYPLVFGITLLP